MKLSLRALTSACVLALAASPAHGRFHDPEKMPETRILDLHYGDALFYFYQDKDFEALTRLLAYEHWKRMPHHEDEARLLTGGLYLTLGMHNEAGAIFQKLLTDDVPTGVRNRAWFYLAQVWYARGYLDKADAALRRVNGRMSPELEARKELLFGNVLIHEGRFDEAIRVLSGWRGGPDWSAYARFNLGVALVRAGRLADADPFLASVGTMPGDTPELAALRDRANLALGFAYLQANQPARARPALERVRLDGPYSDKALLGTGWADAALGDYQGALTPWLALHERNVLDAAVQESYLAVPYAFAKLNANAQSAEYYESAVAGFKAEDTRLDAAIARIRHGDLLRQVLERAEGPQGTRAPRGWFWQLKQLPDAPESRYLYALFAGHDFQEGLKNYRDLVDMSSVLARRSDSMGAFQDMIAARQRAYAQRLPAVDALLASGAIGKLQQRDAGLEAQLRTIEDRHDVAALGTKDERAQWARVQRVEAAVADTPDNPDLHERVSLIRGVLWYRLDEAFNARLWQAHRQLKDVNLALQEAQSRWIRVARDRRSVPTNTGEFAARIAALESRLAALQVRLADAQRRQGDYLAQLAVQELGRQQGRLAAYRVQARFALATMYDRAANAGAAHGGAGAPAQQTTPVQPARAAVPAPGKAGK